MKETSTATISYLSFEINGQLFVANVSNICKIIEMTELSFVPNVPDYIRGIIRLEDDVIPIIDLRVLFNLKQIENTNQTSILILEILQKNKVLSIGLIVERVHEVIEINDNQIINSPTIEGFENANEFIKGLVAVNNKNILIIDFISLFNPGKIKEFTKVIKGLKINN